MVKKGSNNNFVWQVSYSKIFKYCPLSKPVDSIGSQSRRGRMPHLSSIETEMLWALLYCFQSSQPKTK